LLEDIPVASFIVSSFGLLVLGLFAGRFTAPSWQTFLLLTCGWALTRERPTITTSLWLTGATTVKPFSRFYVFLGGARYQARWQLWARIIPCAAPWVPATDPSVIEGEDSTKKKAGTPIEGLARSRNGAGSARQEYRTLRGLNFVWGILRVPLPRWPQHCLSVPSGLSLSLKEEQAHKLKRPYHSRRARARAIVDFVATQLPARQMRVLGDGGYATTECLRRFPPAVAVVSRRLLTGKLSERPPQSPGSRRGCPPQKGPLLGSPQTLARHRPGWQPQPTETGALVQAGEGLWHAGLPGRPIRVVGVRRPAPNRTSNPGQRKPPPPVEAFFTTELSLSLEAILEQYRDRWAVEITIRASNAFAGFGHEQCRKVERVVGANTLRLALVAARTLWFVEQASRADTLDLQRSRPWYRKKCAPSQLDIVWACRAVLHEAGVFPLPRFAPDLAENHKEPENTLPLAA
jgi:hypothetical protein